MPTIQDPSRVQRIELILQEIDSIPTPSPLALRLLSAASDENVDIDDIITMIESDPGITARLLGMCRRSSTGLGDSITTVDRAVVMLGLDALRAMLLSVDIHEFMRSNRNNGLDDSDQTDPAQRASIDRAGLWTHGLAVACASEHIVRTHAHLFKDVKPDEAFVCGLLHDVGKIALDLVLPRSLAKAVNLADRRCESLAAMEKTIIGLDHTLAGKHLAERWELPEVIRDVIWLHGRPAQAIPNLPHKRMIGVVSAANDIARLMHVGDSGNGAPPRALSHIADEWGFDEKHLEKVAVDLHQRVSARSAQLGMDEIPPVELLAQSLGSANRTLVHLNERYGAKMRRLDRIEGLFEAIQSFNKESRGAGSSLFVARSAVHCGQRVFGAAETISVVHDEWESCWTIERFDKEGHLRKTATARLSLHPGDILDAQRAGAGLSNKVAKQIALALGWDASKLDSFKPLVLHAGKKSGAILLHTWRLDRERGIIIELWRSVTASTFQQSRSDRLAEEVVELNTELMQSRQRASEIETCARLGAITAGVAHEMNNPLAVMSGRAQLLRDALGATRHQKEVETLIEAAQQLSDLVAGLHFVSTPPTLHRSMVDLTEFLPRVIKKVRKERARRGLASSAVRLTFNGALPSIFVDPGLFSVAVAELLRNALEAADSHKVELHIQTEPSDDRLKVSVIDDGQGVSPEVLAHAADPFISSKEAGRQTGMGLAKTRQIVELHGGRLQLFRRGEGGTEASITLDVWRPEQVREELEHSQAA